MCLEGNSLVEFIEVLLIEVWLGLVMVEGCFKVYENFRMVMKLWIFVFNVLELSIYGREDYSMCWFCCEILEFYWYVDLIF